MSECGDLSVVPDVVFANEILVFDSQRQVKRDLWQAADWRVFGLGDFDFGKYEMFAVAFFVEVRVDLFFF